jgi:hypothetical protein
MILCVFRQTVVAAEEFLLAIDAIRQSGLDHSLPRWHGMLRGIVRLLGWAGILEFLSTVPGGCSMWFAAVVI